MLELELYTEGWEEFPKWWVFLENLQFLLYWAVGFVGMYWLQADGLPVVSILYAAFIVVVVGIVLKKHNCATCYYYDKWCHLGWGKLAAKMFERDAGNRKLGMKIANVVYPLIAFGPLAAMVISLILKFRVIVLGCLIVYFFWGILQFAILRKEGCRRCKLRYVCEGSAAKK